MVENQRLLWHLWDLGFHLSWEKDQIGLLPKKERSESLLLDLAGLRPLGTVIRVLDEGSWGREGVKSY